MCAKSFTLAYNFFLGTMSCPTPIIHTVSYNLPLDKLLYNVVQLTWPLC